MYACTWGVMWRSLDIRGCGVGACVGPVKPPRPGVTVSQSPGAVNGGVKPSVGTTPYCARATVLVTQVSASLFCKRHSHAAWRMPCQGGHTQGAHDRASMPCPTLGLRGAVSGILPVIMFSCAWRLPSFRPRPCA